MAWLLNRDTVRLVGTTHTRFSTPSTASSFPLYSLWHTEKLLRPLKQGIRAGIEKLEIAGVEHNPLWIAMPNWMLTVLRLVSIQAEPAGFSSSMAMPCPPPMHAEAMP